MNIADTAVEKLHKSRSYYINYIVDNIDYLQYENKRELLQKIIQSDIEKNKIVQKGGGTQIKFSSIDDKLLLSIHDFIKFKIENSYINF